jgi:hypothetical protein
VFPVRYELAVYIPEDRILHSPRHVNLKSYISMVSFFEIVAREKTTHR